MEQNVSERDENDGSPGADTPKPGISVLPKAVIHNVPLEIVCFTDGVGKVRKL